MYIESKIYKSEKQQNLDKKPTANTEYYQAFVEDADGSLKFALFTEHDISRAITRGAKNPEDRGTPLEHKPSAWWKFWKS